MIYNTVIYKYYSILHNDISELCNFYFKKLYFVWFSLVHYSIII